MIRKLDVMEIKYITTIPCILDYDAYICNSRKQKLRESIRDNYSPNCLMYNTAINILESLEYKQVEEDIFKVFNDDIYSIVKMVKIKPDEFSISQDYKGALIYGEHWKDYPDPYLFKIISYKRHYRLATTTAQELNEMKNCICKSYMNELGRCTDLKTEICPLCEVYTDTDMHNLTAPHHQYTCGYLHKDFNTEEEYVEYYDNLIHSIYNGAFKMGIIDHVGKIHHENIASKNENYEKELILKQLKYAKDFARKE